MKKIRNITFLFALLVTVFSCEKNEIEYDTTDVTGKAEFQLHYVVPVVAGAANNITKVEINGQLYANATAPLATYNAIPSGSVGRFYTTKVGENNIKLYRGANMDLVYDKNVTLNEGKQNIFVYDFNEPPKVIDNGYPYQAIITDTTAEIQWVKFYNFLFEKEGVPTDLKLQYQYQYVVNNETQEKSAWLNVGKPVSFGESTGWEPIPVNITIVISSGNARIDYRIHVIDQAVNDLGDLKVMNASNAFVNYADWWTGNVGRRYHHILSGMRAAKPISAVRQFTAL